MIEVLAIDHVVLRTSMLDDMLGFYRDLLGCRVERELDPAIGLVQLRAGASLIDLVTVESELGRMGGAAPGQDGHNVDHFCLTITKLDEQQLIRHLDNAGVEHGEFSERYGAQGFGRSIYIKDPQGNTVELKMDSASR